MLVVGSGASRLHHQKTGARHSYRLTTSLGGRRVRKLRSGRL